MFTAIDLLSPEQCDEVCANIHGLKPLWTSIHPPNTFYTLGTASYINFTKPDEGADVYFNRAGFYNPILKEHFGWLIETVREAIQHQLGEPVRITEEFAIPGFHIFESPSVPREPSSSLHFDLQYEHLTWPLSEEIDFSRPLSFTLPVRLPFAGGGIVVWDIEYTEYLDALRRGLVSRVEDLQEVRSKSFYRYRLGRLVLHSGHLLHQIAHISQVQNDDERITLQGHALRRAGMWELYW